MNMQWQEIPLWNEEPPFDFVLKSCSCEKSIKSVIITFDLLFWLFTNKGKSNLIIFKIALMLLCSL